VRFEIDAAIVRADIALLLVSPDAATNRLITLPTSTRTRSIALLSVTAAPPRRAGNASVVASMRVGLLDGVSRAPVGVVTLTAVRGG
jgi:hypothetical protein